MIKKWLTVALALAAILLPAELAMARGGGRGGGGGGRGGRGGPGAGMGGGRGGNRGGNTKKRARELMRERSLAENRDAAVRDEHADSI